jgi:alpha-1,3-glucan synthase
MLDIDGFRFDKATQVTVDAQGDFAEAIRACAKKFGKDNFFMPGEISGGNTFGAIYVGRGREPDQANLVKENVTAALLLSSDSMINNKEIFLRAKGKGAYDGAAFHYSVYRHLTRMLGMDGNLTVSYDTPPNLVEIWNTMMTTNDFINPNTDELDPRHMYGVTNQDVFRWPALENGTQKMLLGLFITTLLMPGIPLLFYGEEQAMYVLDSTAPNYIFGRSPMSSAVAWQNHGCYNLGSSQYHEFPVDVAAKGCEDDMVSLDHRDPAHPIRNIIKSMYRLRAEYPILNDGLFLKSLSNMTHQVFLPGSNSTATEVGLWSVMRDQYPGVQNLNLTTSRQPVWLVFSNEAEMKDFKFDCESNATALSSPFPQGTTVKNLLAPYDEHTLKSGPRKLVFNQSDINGCLDTLRMESWSFKAYVPKNNWVEPAPTITKFHPGHDHRILASNDSETSVDIAVEFSREMACASVTNNLEIESTTTENSVAKLDPQSVKCESGSKNDQILWSGQIPSIWTWSATLHNVPSGVHIITIKNASLADGTTFMESTDHFMLRVGHADNPIVFPRTADYNAEVLFKESSGALHVSHKASGADKWRYSLNWGSTYSAWSDYSGGNSTLEKQDWKGTKRQAWKGDHVILQYWSRATGSSSHLQHGDAQLQKSPRRFPHLFAHGLLLIFHDG